MQFGPVQQKFFNANKGSYSIVTEREVFDSQITLTDAEMKLALEFFGKNNIFVGNVRTGGLLAKKSFRLHGSDREIELNLVFPKPNNNELRLYLSKRAGYKPEPGDVWFLYPREGALFIGAMKEDTWRSIGRNDPEDELYQNDLHVEDETIRTSEMTGVIKVRRDPRLAIKRFEITGFECEVDRRHKLFTSRTTDKPYLEGHHLVPIKYQDFFKTRKLDRIENLFCLCPYCHSAIHHAVQSTTTTIVLKLIAERRDVLGILGLETEDVLRYYNCEDILRETIF